MFYLDEKERWLWLKPSALPLLEYFSLEEGIIQGRHDSSLDITKYTAMYKISIK